MWKARGEVNFDFARVCLAPPTFVFSASTIGWDSTTSVPGQYFGNHTVPQGFIPLDEGAELSNHATWQQMAVTVTIPAPGVYRLVVLWRNDGNTGEEPTITIDDLNIVRQSCMAPSNVSVYNLRQTSASIGWDSTDVLGWIFEWDTVDGTSYSYSTFLTVPHYDFTTLARGASVRCRVRAVCNASDTSRWTNYSFHTPTCDFISELPYTIDFDNDVTVTGNSSMRPVIECWTHVNNGTTYFGYPYFTNASSYAHTGSRVLYWYYPSGTSATYGKKAGWVLPGLDLDTMDIHNVVVSFWACANGSGYRPKWLVGVCTDPTNPDSFVAVDSVETTLTSMQEFAIPLSAYAGTGNFVSIRMGRPTGMDYSYGYMDDIKLTYEPCSRPGIRTDSVLTTSAHFSWSSTGAVYYEYVLDTADFENPATYYDTVLNLTNLNPNTPYTLYVRSVCTSGEGEWTHRDFRTACGDIALPFFDSFEGYPSGGSTSEFAAPCWHRLNNATSYFGYPYIYASTSYAHTGNTGLYWYRSNTAGSYGDYQFIILPYTSHFADSLMVSFWAKASYDDYHPEFVVGVFTDPDSISTFVPVDTLTGMTTQWDYYEVPLNRYQGQGHYVAIGAFNNGQYWYAYVDDVGLDFIPACPRPTDLVLDSATTNSLTFHWTGPANGSQWLVTVDTTEYETFDTTITVNGLAASMGHDISIRAICASEDDTSYALNGQLFTTCGELYPSNLPLFESFEGYVASSSSTSQINPCWDRRWYDYGNYSQGGSYYCYVYDYYSHTGSQCIYMYGEYDYDYYSHLILPRIGDSISSMMIEFWAMGYNGSVVVGYMTDPAVDSTFHTLGTYPVSNNNWQRYECYFTTVPDSIHYVALSTKLPGTYCDLYIDDIKLKMIPTCFYPTTVALDHATEDSLCVTWLAENGTEWLVDIDSSIYYVTDTVFEIGGLTANTPYTFRIASLCSGDTSEWYETTFRTACGMAELPFVDNFDSYTTQTAYSMQLMPPCYEYTWVTTNSSYQNASYKPSVYYDEYGDYAHSGMYSICSNGENIFILPQMPASVDSLRLSFWTGGGYSDEYTLEVGVVDDSNIFHLVASTPCDYNWQQYFVYFTDYEGPDGRIAFRNTNTYSYGYTYSYIDDIRVDYAPTCIDPTIELVNLSNNQATVQFGISAANTYIVEYGTGNFTHGNGTTIVVTGNQATLTNLQSNTAYKVYARGICSATDTSEWSMRPLSFTTNCDPVSVPFTDNFDNATAGTMPSCWRYTMLSSGYSDSYYWPQVYNYATYAASGSQTLWLYGKAYTCLPPMNVPLDSLQLTFTQYCSGTYYGLQVGVMEGNTFIPIDDITVSSTGLQAPHTTYFNTYTGSSRTIAFYNYYVNSPSSGYSYHYIDDLTVDYAPSCIPVGNIHAENVTTTGVTIHWEGTVAPQYEVEYGPEGFAQGQGTSVVATADSLVLTNLSPSSMYDVYVRAICAAGDTALWSMGSVATECGGIIEFPYTVNFDRCIPNSNGTMPTCWTKYSNYSSSYPYVYDYYSYSGGNSLYFYYYDYNNQGYYTYAALPAMGVSLDSLQVSFYVYCSSSTVGYGEMIVGVMTDPNDYSTFVGIDTVSNSNYGTWQRFTVPFHGYTGTGRNIAFSIARTNSGTYYGASYIDDVVVNYVPCVIDLEVDSITTNTAVVDWTDVCNSTAWEIEYGTGDFSHGNGTIVNAASHPYTLTGLNASSSYTVYVRPAGASHWSDDLHFTTACGAVNVPYFEDFEGYAGTTYSTAGVMPNCWGMYSDAMYNYYDAHVVGSGTYWYTHSGSKSLIMTSGSSTYGGTKIVALPEFAEPMQNLKMSYWVCTEDNAQQAGILEVGYTTSDTTDPAHFVALKTIPSSNLTVHSGTGLQTNHGLLDTITFDTVPATARHIAFRWCLTSSYYSVCLDDIEVTSIVPPCHEPVIASVATTWNDAVVTWTGDGQNYEVAVKQTADEWPVETAVQALTYNFTGLAPATEYQFRIRQNCDTLGYSDWTVGTFTTDSLPCFTPEALQLVAESGLAAVLDWTAAEGQTAWELNVFNTTFNQTFAVTEHPAPVTGLTAGVTYYATVRAVCGNGASYSDWSDTINFTTSVCAPVTNVTATVNGVSATITWNPGDNNTGQWEIEYGLAGFSQGDGTTVQVSNSTAIINNLMDEATYDVYVRAICGPGYVSTWSNKTSFTTEHIGIAHIDGGLNVAIYPNPATGNTTISLSGINGSVNIAIVDMNGRTVMSDAMECEGDCVKTLNVDNLAQGAYFVRIYSDSVNTVKKLIVR